jgi:hypothetical protein
VPLLNRTLTAFFDALFVPLAWMSPVAGLAVLSLLTAVAVLLAFKWTANQPALAAAKQAMQASIFEMRLFNDDLVLLFRAQADVVRHSLTYLRLSLTPTLWLIVPLTLLMLHMEFHFGYTGLAAGSTALVKVRLAAPGATASAALQAPDAIVIETPAVVLPSEREVVWRIRPRQTGSYELRVTMGGTEIVKTLLVSDIIARRSPVRPDGALTAQLLYPSESPLPSDAGVTSIVLEYPTRDVRVAGWNVGWVGVYLVLTLAFAWLLKGVFGVTM